MESKKLKFEELKKRLKEENIKFRVVNKALNGLVGGFQLMSGKLSVIIHNYSYGGSIDLFEVWDGESTKAEGWLSVDQVVKILKKGSY